MTDAQIFQFLGIAFFAIGVGMLQNPKFISEITQELRNSTANLFYGGLFCLAIGFPIITFHNTWDLSWSLVITLLGWLSLLKGLMLLMFPAYTMDRYKDILTEKNKTYASYFILALGIVSLYLGFWS